MLQQLDLAFPERWGGRRKGAGRKRTKPRDRVLHRPRAHFHSRYPVHVTVKLRTGLPSLRKRATRRIVRAIFRETNAAGLLRVVHFSVQHTHLHLLVECDGAHELGRGMKSLNTKLARRLNRLWGRTGSLLKERYHHHVLETPTAVRNALRYVLRNAQHHRTWDESHDPHSSSASFDGWRLQPDSEQGRAQRARRRLRQQQRRTPLEAVLPETWLMTVGWALGYAPPKT